MSIAVVDAEFADRDDSSDSTPPRSGPDTATIRTLLDESLIDLAATLADLKASLLRLSSAEGSIDSGRFSDGPPPIDSPAHPLEADVRPNDSAIDLLDWIKPPNPASRPTAGKLAAELRDHIASAMYAGDLRSGDRLPSIRDCARHTGVNRKTVGRAYDHLAADGIVELRPRSGAYVARHPSVPLDAEPPAWVSRVLAEAAVRPEGIAGLPDLINRYLGARELSCACVDATEDLRADLTFELRKRFGLRVYPLRCRSGSDPGEMDDDRLGRDLEAVDLVVTTPYHPEIARLARDLSKPLVVVAPEPSFARDLRFRLRQGPVHLVCVDPEFGRRIRLILRPELRDRLRVIDVAAADSLTRLARSTSVMITDAAAAVIGQHTFQDASLRPSCLGAESGAAVANAIANLNAAVAD